MHMGLSDQNHRPLSHTPGIISALLVSGGIVSRFGLAVRQKDLGSNPLRLSFLFQKLWSVDTESERERDRQIDRQTDRQTEDDRERERQTDREKKQKKKKQEADGTSGGRRRSNQLKKIRWLSLREG